MNPANFLGEALHSGHLMPWNYQADVHAADQGGLSKVMTPCGCYYSIRILVIVEIVNSSDEHDDDSS